MKTVKATEIKQRLGRYLQMSVTEPVLIERTGRPFAVIVPFEEYERLTRLEDAYWAERARLAEQEGFWGVDESMDYLKKALDNVKA